MTLHRTLRLVSALIVFTGAAGLTALADRTGQPDEEQARTLKGSYQIRNQKYAESDLVLRPRDASSAELNPIVLYPRTDWKCLTWRVDPSGDGERLVNHFTNKTFRPRATPKEGDTSVPVVQVTPSKTAAPAEQWKFVATSKDTFRIIHVATGWVLTAEKQGDDVRIVIAPWADRDEQKWQTLDGPKHFSS